VKKAAAMLVLAGAVVFSSVAFAGNGAGLNAHLARIDAHVAKFESKCNVATPKAQCAARKARIVAHLTKFESRLDARIAKVKHAARKARLQAARDHIASLIASLS
jgi:hypothetical protein